MNMWLTNPFVFMLQALPVFLVAGPSALVVSRPVHIDEPQSSDHAFTDDNWAARQRLRNDVQASVPFRLDHHFFMAAATSATLSTSTALNSSCFHEYSIGHGRTGMNMWLTNPFVFMLQALPVFLVAGPSALVVSRPVHIDEPQSSDHAFTDDNWAARQRLRNDVQASVPFRLDHHFFMAAATSATLSTSTALNSSCFHEYSIGHGRTGMNMWLTNPFVFMLQALPVFLVAGPSALVVSRPVHIDEPQSSDHAFTDDNWAARQRLRNDVQASVPFRLDHHFFMAAATSATLSTSTALNSSCFHEYSIGHGRTGMNMWLTNPFVFMLQCPDPAAPLPCSTLEDHTQPRGHAHHVLRRGAAAAEPR
ncbi:uncharacterized protein [Dermacentor albipictus]|uniref:uncharacterized protein n=1 Tax=Dermacentor albipictus TaxID=60249 RepID=UPI0038FD1D45